MQGLIPAPLMQGRSCICGHTVKLTVALYSYACSTFLYSRYGLISSSIETLTQDQVWRLENRQAMHEHFINRHFGSEVGGLSSTVESFRVLRARGVYVY